jgi:16S rRNA processing protein RimM
VEGAIRFGRVGGFRGNAGEVTVRVVSGEGSRWVGLRSVRLSGGPVLEVESARAYGDRLVLKLRGIDDPSAADALRGAWLEAAPGEVPPLPEGTYFVERLIGLEAVDESRGSLGVVEDVLETGGVELLQIRETGGAEILVPFAEGIVTEVDVESGFVRLRAPEGLLDLNRETGAER